MRAFSAAALALGVWLLAGTAAARTRVCVEVDAGRADPTELERLVMSELNRHTSHQAVKSGCESQLTVELVQLDPELGGGRYVTARLDTEVPHRETIVSGDTARAVERLLTVVLHNDPRRLQGPERDDWIGRTRDAFLRHGTTYYALELSQTLAIVGGEVQGLPGAALAARREVDRVHVGVRIGAASVLEGGAPTLRLSQQFLAQLEVALFSSSESDSAWFAAIVAGLEYQRYEATIPDSDPRRVTSSTFSGLSLGARAGVELLRTSHVRFQFFGQLLAPTFAARDESGNVDQWTPTAALGVAASL